MPTPPTSPNPERVIVVGGGPTGLTCAWRLVRRGIDVLLLEAGAQVGGKVRTLEEGGYRLECGPHAFLGSATGILDLARDAGIQDQLVPTRHQATGRYIVRSGRAHRAPDSLLSLLTTGLLSPLGRLRLACEPFRRAGGTPEDTARDFFRRRFGGEAADVLAGAFINGVYAGDPGQLSAPAAFPLFWDLEQESGSMLRGLLGRRFRHPREPADAPGQDPPAAPPRKGLFSFRGGLGTLTATLARGLGERCRTDAPVQSIERSDGMFLVRAGGETFQTTEVVIATPPHAAARLLRSMDGSLARELEGIPLAPVAVVHAGFERRLPGLPDAFGVLAAPNQGAESLGILFPSRLFADRCPRTGPALGGDLLCGFFGGVRRPEQLSLSDGELLDLMARDLSRLFGIQERPSFLRVRRHATAIPQLVVGHAGRCARIAERLQRLTGTTENLVLAGNYIKGIGLKDAIQSGEEAAGKVLRALGLDAAGYSGAGGSTDAVRAPRPALESSLAEVSP